MPSLAEHRSGDGVAAEPVRGCEKLSLGGADDEQGGGLIVVQAVFGSNPLLYPLRSGCGRLKSLSRGEERSTLLTHRSGVR
jgi:hypothetical protein